VGTVSGQRVMDFLEPYWSRLQVELWVCTRSGEAVGLAEHAPGRTRLGGLSIGPGGLDDEAYDEYPPVFDDEIDLIGTAIINHGFVCPFDDARRRLSSRCPKGSCRSIRIARAALRSLSARRS